MKSYAFIDASNLFYGGEKSLGWKIDYLKLIQYLKNKYGGTLKRNLRKAEDAGIIIREGVQPEDVTNYFRNARGNELGHFSESDYETLNRLQYAAIEKKSCFTLGAYDKNNSLIAAASFLPSHDRIVFLKGAPTLEGREAHAMHCIMDNVIKKYSEQNLILDFGGSVIPNVARFNQSFGAEDYLYLLVKRNRLPFYIRWLKK